MESYELIGKHTYLPMSITIGSLLVMLLLLAVPYEDLAPKHTQRETAVISATSKLDMAQEISSGMHIQGVFWIMWDKRFISCGHLVLLHIMD